MPQRPRHPEVDHQRTPGFEPNDQVLAAPVDRSTRSLSSSRATSIGSCGRVRRASAISTRANRRPSSSGASRRRTVSTSGSSGIRPRYRDGLPGRAETAGARHLVSKHREIGRIPPTGECRARDSTRRFARWDESTRVEVERWPLPRGHARQRSAADLLRELEREALRAAARPDRRPVRLERTCLLPDDEPLPPGAADPGRRSFERDLRAERKLREAHEQSARTVESSLRQALLERVDRHDEYLLDGCRYAFSTPNAPGRSTTRAAGAGARSQPLSATCAPQLSGDRQAPGALRSATRCSTSGFAGFIQDGRDL